MFLLILCLVTTAKGAGINPLSTENSYIKNLAGIVTGKVKNQCQKNQFILLFIKILHQFDILTG
jgi:hypothetical protein